MKSSLFKNKIKQIKISEAEVKCAIKIILKWIGEDPNREGLIETPRRVMEKFKEHFAGYFQNPNDILLTTFSEISGYKDLILLKNIDLHSHCEHHLASIKGVAHIGYYPNIKVIGISKLARVVDIYSKRLQIQERLTSEIASIINFTLKPKGVAVMIEASHNCISDRAIKKKNIKMRTYAFLGCFNNNANFVMRFFQSIR